MCLSFRNARLSDRFLIAEHLLHRETPVRSEYVTGLGARLVILRPIILRCFHRELVDMCPELRHLDLAHLGSKLSHKLQRPQILNNFPTQSPRLHLRCVPRSLALGLLAFHLSFSPS